MKTAQRIAFLQFCVGLVSAIIWLGFKNAESGIAAAVGGLIAALLTFYAGLKTFGVRGNDPQAVVANFYRAQMRKLLLAVFLFAIAVKLFAASFVPLIVTFMIAWSVYWFALLWDT